tara:strand:- start:161 stop:469 length:309 start_codon:yes stop_codon:yes gene_type:complete
MINYFNSLSNNELIFLIIGFLGQGLFASRFIYQWIYSEKKGESIIPIGFWYLSIFGGLSLLTYAIFRKDPVIISGQLFGVLIYSRNLYLIYRKKSKLKNLHE